MYFTIFFFVILLIPKGHAQTCVPFNIANYVTNRLLQTYRSSSFYPLLSPAQQQQLESIVRNPSISRTVENQQLGQIATTLSGSTQTAFTSWFAQFGQLFQDFGQYLQNFQCSSAAQSYCNQIKQAIGNQNLSNQQEEQQITSIINSVSPSLQSQLQSFVRQLDYWFVGQLCQRGLAPNDPIAAVCNFCINGCNTNTGSSSCIDNNSNCATWATNGFCTSTFYTTAEKAQYCPKTCNLCTFG